MIFQHYGSPPVSLPYQIQKNARRSERLSVPDNFYISEGLINRKYAKPRVNSRKSATIAQPAADMTLGSIPTKKETPNPMRSKIKRDIAADLRAPLSCMPPANQLSNPGTTSAVPSNWATRFSTEFDRTVAPMLKPKMVSMVLGASNNPAAKTNATSALTMNKFRNFMRMFLSLMD